MLIPNRYHAPLHAEEALAEYHQDSPDRLIELAEATGNRGLRAVAFGLTIEKQRQNKKHKHAGR